MERRIKGRTWSIQAVATTALGDDAHGWLQEAAHLYKLRWLLAHADDGVIWGAVVGNGAATSLALQPGGPSLSLETLQAARLFSTAAELLVWRDGRGAGARGTWHARLVRDLDPHIEVKETEVEEAAGATGAAGTTGIAETSTTAGPTGTTETTPTAATGVAAGSAEASEAGEAPADIMEGCSFDEEQILWGTHGEEAGVVAGVTFVTMSDGAQGLRHTVPLTEAAGRHNGRPLRLSVRHYILEDGEGSPVPGVARVVLSRLRALCMP